MKPNTIYNMDCRIGLKKLADESIDCCISSPPYWSLRDYGLEGSVWGGDVDCAHEFEMIEKKDPMDRNGNSQYDVGSEKAYKTDSFKFNTHEEGFCLKCGAWKGCLGLEPTFEQFISNLCDIYDLLMPKLKKSGTVWVNLGDTYGGSGGAGGDYNEGGLREGQPKFKQAKQPKSYQKCLLMIPQRFAIEMINRGWILRNVIIWHKPNCMPSSARDRFTVDFEYVYLFVKAKKYWFDQDAVREPLTEATKNRDKYSRVVKNGKHSTGEINNAMDYERDPKSNPKGRNKRTVWKIPTKPNPLAHFATFPPALVEPMIKSGCPKDGVVLDPFSGIGTTARKAWELGRNYIGFELQPDYFKLSLKYLEKTKNNRIDQYT